MLPDVEAEDTVDDLPERGDSKTDSLINGTDLEAMKTEAGRFGETGTMEEKSTGGEGNLFLNGNPSPRGNEPNKGGKKFPFMPVSLGILGVCLLLMVTSGSEEGGFEETLPYLEESATSPMEDEVLSLLEDDLLEEEESLLSLEEHLEEETLPVEEAVVLPSFTPKIKEMFSICELAVLETRYNNVAKYKEEKASFFGKETHFWVEYTGIVQIGVDLSHVDIQLTDNVVTIYLPKTTVLSSKVDESSLTESSYIYGNKSKAADAAIQVEAITFAQNQMFEIAMSDTSLLNVAQQRVQLLLESYIRNVGELTGVDYEIQWILLDENGKRL